MISARSSPTKSEARPVHADLCSALSDWANRQPDAPALSDASTELTYAELLAEVDDAADRLAGLGVEPGERVAVVGRNTIEWILVFLGALRSGAIVVPLNYRLSPREIARQLEVCQPRVTLAAEDLVERLEGAGVDSPLTLERESARCLFDIEAAPRQPDNTAAASTAVISFTSGTTGPPKGAMITHAGLVASAKAYAHCFGTTSADRTLVLVPLFHNTAFVDQLAQMVLVGGSVDLVEEFSVRGAIEALSRRPASYLIAVPSIYRLLMLSERADEAFAGCRIAAYGGAPMPEAWINELQERWPHMRLFNVYGLTEFTAVSHILGPEHLPERGGSVGPPVAGVRHRVVDEAGNELPPGSVGEIQLVGPTRMVGYWGNGAANSQALEGAWLRTGDLGWIGEDDFLSVKGRACEVINRGGEKIYASQVEAALCRIDGIGEAAVVGAPHPIFQECVVACVTTAEESLDEAEVRRALLDELPDYAVPEALVVRAELPRNAAAKVDRRAIRALAEDAIAAKGTRR